MSDRANAASNQMQKRNVHRSHIALYAFACSWVRNGVQVSIGCLKDYHTPKHAVNILGMPTYLPNLQAYGNTSCPLEPCFQVMIVTILT